MRIAVIMIMAVMWLPVSADKEDYDPSEIINPNIADSRQYVADPAGYLRPETVAQVNANLDAVRRLTTCEMGVVVVPTTGDMLIEDYTRRIFDNWKLGKADKDNGLLLVIAVGDRIARLQTGYGLEGVLPDIACRDIIRHDVAPSMVAGSVDAAVSNAVSSVEKVLTDPAYAEELRSGQKNIERQAPVSAETLWQFVRIVAFCVFVFALAMFCFDLRQTRRLDNYSRSMRWRSHVKAYVISAVLSLGAGIIFPLLAAFFARRYRLKPVKCDTCGKLMKRLDEEADNAYLTPGQDMEERLDTVDYDVWLCPECGTVERFPYRRSQTVYSECPNCHTVAMTEKYVKTTVPATTRHAGQGEKVSECMFCHHRKHESFIIPKKEDGSAAALAAGAILGSMSRGGGSGFGGGFGGGSTGGGGASGGW